uniref:NADH-ubiquinone oxidoreductase 49 kDa subunit n=2 Tax=Nyctotherus ovalis TaxID=70075 RepID=NDUS2_NYCOV|nr:RecName: Full=NADH-ubiquinone oxidoreductase 49 kDa subunit; AltName: Full=NADH dehydrogenase subunit 7 [Nyctotherus ovalis]CAI38863.1 NADH dehydrogenase subunit 7 [Nyctotherus ovalis]
MMRSSSLQKNIMLLRVGSKDSTRFRILILNFGPQHPASHGVLRLVIVIIGEVVTKLDPHIGFLHRGTERLVEEHSYMNAAVFMDRLDYTTVLTQTHAYCLAVEQALAKSRLCIRTQLLRTIFDELSRILNHLLSIATHALDIGTMAMLFWAFEDRERIMELYEYISGARMHTALYYPNQTLDHILTNELLAKILIFSRNSEKTYTEIYIALYNNRVWRLRLCGIGVVSTEISTSTTISGPVARSTGLQLDMRSGENYQYGYYASLTLRIFLGISGDSFDRFIIRLRELFESTRLIYNSLIELSAYINISVYNMCSYSNNPHLKIESLIELFRYSLGEYLLNISLVSGFVESGKGIFGIMLAANNTNRPYRLYIRSPAYMHLQLLPKLGAGHHIADLATLLGSIDVVFGEVDR